METAGEFFEVVGMMAVLGSAAIVFITIIQWLAGKRRNRAALGVEIVVFFSFLYAFDEPILKWLSLDTWVTDVENSIATLWWLSLAFLFNTVIKKFVWEGILAERGETTVPRLLTDFVALFVYLMAIMIVMHFVYGEPITAIAATSGAAAFIIGYSAQSTLGELFAGISLNLSANIKKGDLISFGDVTGRVDDVNWRSVAVYDFARDAHVIYPNSALAGTEFWNLSRPTRRMRGEIEVTVEFSAPPERVTRAIREALADSRFVLRDPPPRAFVKGTNEMGIEYGVLYFFRRFEDRFLARDEAMNGIWSGFFRYDIQPGISHREFGPGGRFDEGGWPARQEGRESIDDLLNLLAASPIFAGVPSVDLGPLVVAARRRGC